MALWASIIMLSGVSLAFSQQVIPTRAATPPPEFTEALKRFNADVAAWNKRCAVTRSGAEDARCQKELARIKTLRAKLIAQGAIPRR